MAHLDDKIKLENYKFDSNTAEHFAVWQSNIENMVRTIANGKPLIDGMHLLAIMWHADPAPASQKVESGEVGAGYGSTVSSQTASSHAHYNIVD